MIEFKEILIGLVIACVVAFLLFMGGCIYMVNTVSDCNNFKKTTFDAQVYSCERIRK
jgi:Mg/Co/Ni transporter MgtE